MKRLLFICLSSFFLFAGCERKIDIVALPTSINPADVNLLSKFLTMPFGTKLLNGIMPTTTTGQGVPVITNFGNTSVTTSNGGTTALTVNISNQGGGIQGYYIQLEGSNIYFQVPYTASADNPNIINIPIGIPTMTENGSFCVLISVYDGSNRISRVVRQCVDVLKLGSGSLQVNLTWNTNYTDIDLHVLDPSGTEIYYANDYSSTGGELDRDDVDGFGPENIFWLGTAPDGQYKVWIEYYSGSTPTTSYVTINVPGRSKSFQASMSRSGDRRDIVTITKRGDNYSF